MKKILMLSILLIVGTAQAEIVIVESSPVTRITVVCVGGHIFVKDSTSLIQMYTAGKIRTLPYPLKCKDYKK